MNIDTSNSFTVVPGENGEVRIYAPPRGALSRAEAINLAGWLVVMANVDLKDFEEVVEEIKNL